MVERLATAILEKSMSFEEEANRKGDGLYTITPESIMAGALRIIDDLVESVT